MENPANNTATPGDPSFLWKPEPTQRGTFGIFFFCFSTLIICVWSALHFDIPATRIPIDKLTYKIFIPVFWMVVAVIAPEALLCAAINQRVDAEILMAKVVAEPTILARLFYFVTRRAKPDAVSTQLPNSHILVATHWTWQKHHTFSSQLREQPFCLVHAFYVTMGGFILDLSGIGEEGSTSEPSTSTRHVLTPAAFIYIMEHFPEIIPDISEDSITDRSESSSLSKALLIVQVGWFCADCISRLIQRLPLSLLEVSTAAHAVCTLLTYWVWWSKPLNIAEGTPMKGKGVREVYALLMRSEGKDGSSREQAVAEMIAAADSQVVTNNGQQERIVLAADAPLRTSKTLPPVNPFRHRYEWSAPGSLLADSMRSRPHDLAAIAISPILYGLVHFLAWNVHFPKALERKFWHISSALVTFSGLVWVMLAFIMGYLMNRKDICSNTMGVMLAILVVLAIPLTYVLASLFLIGESLRQLFFLDPDAYQVAPLSYYWPHFS